MTDPVRVPTFGSAAELSAGSYRLDLEHVTVVFKGHFLGLLRLVGRFDELDTTFDFDPAEPQAARLVVLVEVANIDLCPPAFEESCAGPTGSTSRASLSEAS